MTGRLGQLRRVRWAVRATLTFGVLASVAANILHARQNPISQTIAAWPPLALLLTVELVSRVPVHRWVLATCRVLATVAIAGIAAWVSYWHMAGVASRYGETGTSPFLLPVSVDGLIVVASICLVELAGRIRHEEATIVQRQSTRVAAPVAPAVGGELVDLDDEEALEDDERGVDEELLNRARAAVVAHRRETGRDITRDQLRAVLRTSNATAGELLRLIREEQPLPASRSAGPLAPVPVRGNGLVVGELRR
jgi:Protein of unknown function (DUF2637)